MCPAALKQAIPRLADKSHYDKIKIFGWWLHVHKRKPSDPGRPNRAIETQEMQFGIHRSGHRSRLPRCAGTSYIELTPKIVGIASSNEGLWR
jgi:hypothetical protein